MQEDTFAQAKDAFLAGMQCIDDGHWSEARAHLQRALVLVPGRPSTLINLAWVHLRLNEAEHALHCADEALQHVPEDTDAWMHRSNALGMLGRLEEGVAAAEHWGSLDPQSARAQSTLGNMLRELGQLPEAAAAYRQAIALGADDATHRYYLAAASGPSNARFTPEAPPSSQAVPASGVNSAPMTAPAHPPREYVEALFDSYAVDFERHVVDDLVYNAPARLWRLLRQHAPHRRFARALDIGCGTGLCGVLMHERCDAVVGVDVSSAMLELAAKRGVYQHLVHDDLDAFLSHENEPYDLWVAADVFIYVGALEPTMLHAKRLLQGGPMVFTVECPDDLHDGYRLEPSLRYAHSLPCVKAALQQAGLQVLTAQRGVIRLDKDKPLLGWYVIAA